MGRNPRTGAAVSVNEKSAAFFKSGRELRTRINHGPPAGKAAAKRIPA
jgi:integration host factor subunit beta